MWGSKYHSGTAIVLLVIVLAIISRFYLSQNSVLPRQVWQGMFRFMVGQETKLTTAQFKEIQTEHYKIKYTTADSDYVSMIAGTAEESYSSVSQKMGWKVQDQTTIVIYPDSASLAKSFGWDKDEKAMGVYWGGTIRILSPREWLKTPFDQAEFIKDGPMVHEFVHLMVDARTKGNYNRWWTEGIAQYMEREITGFEFNTPPSIQQGQLYSLGELAKNFDKLDQPTAYWESLKAIEFIVDQYDEERLYLIMDFLSQGNTIEKAIEKATGNDFTNFAYQFNEYMEKQ